MLDLAHGLHASVPDAAYHQRIPGVASKSALDLVDRSPAHYAAWLAGAEQEETPALAFGKALHCGLLEPEVYASRYVVAPDFGDCRKREVKLVRDAWRKEHAGCVRIDADDAERIAAMVRSVRAHPIASRMLSGGLAECTLRWCDEETGIECKGRADYYVEELALAIDVKTTEDARPASFRRSCATWRYHVQQAMYEAAFAAIGKPLRHFVFVAVEKAPPHAVAVYALDTSAVNQGWRAMRRNLETLRACIERDEWPGYDTSIQTLDLPPWAA